MFEESAYNPEPQRFKILKIIMLEIKTKYFHTENSRVNYRIKPQWVKKASMWNTKTWYDFLATDNISHVNLAK